jgi:hypothetical protein
MKNLYLRQEVLGKLTVDTAIPGIASFEPRCPTQDPTEGDPCNNWGNRND